MIFRASHCDLILAGKKTQTRRLVKDGDDPEVWTTVYLPAGPISHGRIEAVRRMKKDGRFRKLWEIGHAYAVQPGRGKRGLGYIILLKIRKERLQDIGDEDAKAEGASPDMLFGLEYWPPGRTLTDDRAPWTDGQRIGGYRGAFALIWDQINRESGTRWQDNPEVWVLEFELAEAPAGGEARLKAAGRDTALPRQYPRGKSVLFKS